MNNCIIFSMMWGWQEFSLIAIVLLLLFGAKQAPLWAKSLGEGIKEFKKIKKDTVGDLEESINEIKK